MTSPARIAVAALLILSAACAANADPAQDAAATDPSRIPPAVFPHDLHADDMEIECNVCHHETDATPLSLPHPEFFADFWIDCAICHHETGAALASQHCGTCHHARRGDVSDETLSAKVVIHENCWTCHEVGTGAQASESCAFCHVK